MGLNAHIGRKFALALGGAVEADRTTHVFVSGVIGGLGRGVPGLGHRPAVELAGTMGGPDTVQVPAVAAE
ncbi:hypothetical protein WH91_18700 [Devosia psychrophila]|uniref:Uncharacterized protein n=1 Tax=Devosia psychrophila TaxID=728005 RepID=A0ABR5DU90_9HYPH|nr:hypothetical protein WH91_18700 [Devosia psychrophila]